MTQRAYCFTVNNPTDEERLSLTTPPEWVRYLIYQLEEGDLGTPHFQGYVEFNKPKRYAGVKKWPALARAHLERRRGTRDQARDYCKKEEGRLEEPIEFGEWQTGGQGSRSEIVDACKLLKETGSMKRVAEEFANVVVKYSKGLEFYDSLINSNEVPPIPIDYTPWQEQLKEVLDGPVQRRKIYWVWSRDSEQGKSTFASHLAAEMGSDLFMRGCPRMMDTLYLYKRHKVIWFDLPRQTPLDADFTSQIEALSDMRDHVSTKYYVCTKVVIAHIVVSCNRPPPYEKLPNRLVDIEAVLPAQIFLRGEPVSPTISNFS